MFFVHAVRPHCEAQCVKKLEMFFGLEFVHSSELRCFVSRTLSRDCHCSRRVFSSFTRYWMAHLVCAAENAADTETLHRLRGAARFWQQQQQKQILQT